MKFAKATSLLIGFSLLGLVVYETDLAEVWARLRQVGWVGIVVILACNLGAFLCDTMAWQLTLPSVRWNPSWFYQLWKTRMVGNAFNHVTPFASLGGEPVKVVLLKKRYGLGYRETSASLVVERTVNSIALAVFLVAGFVVMMAAGSLPPAYRLAAGIGLGLLSAGIFGFFLVQRFKLFSRAGGWFGRKRAGGVLSFFATVGDVEDRLITFYTRHKLRFAAAVVLGIMGWILGAVEIYYALYFLGYTVTAADALVIEAITVLVRNTLFFIPAGIGAQDGAFVLVTQAIAGSATLGLAVALLRRFREIVWILWGLAIGWGLSLSPGLPTLPETDSSEAPDAVDLRHGSTRRVA